MAYPSGKHKAVISAGFETIALDKVTAKIGTLSTLNQQLTPMDIAAGNEG